MEYKTCRRGISSALVVGGAGGVGEAIVMALLDGGALRVVVADRSRPAVRDSRIEWVRLDLALDDVSALSGYASEVDALIITAGVGRLDSFETFGLGEIERTMRVNAVAAMQILQLFAPRMAAREPFFAAVVTSIAALVSSPLYAVYSASKAALSRYVEAVNAELSATGVSNRVLEVAPGRIEGTAFHGRAPEGPKPLMPLAGSILDAMLGRELRLIPNADVYQGVIDRYHDDPAGFGESSYRYKVGHAELEHRRQVVVGYLSGTFDLFHVGHLNLLRRARSMCDRLVVGVHHSGAWKGKETFVPLEERKAMLAGCRYVDEVVDAPDEDDVAWDAVRYDRLFVGSDYRGTPRFERYERELGARGVEIVYFPYTKGTSSTQIRQAIRDAAKAVTEG